MQEASIVRAQTKPYLLAKPSLAWLVTEGYTSHKFGVLFLPQAQIIKPLG
jgi:hypothetical protein